MIARTRHQTLHLAPQHDRSKVSPTRLFRRRQSKTDKGAILLAIWSGLVECYLCDPSIDTSRAPHNQIELPCSGSCGASELE
jgi:hypothetical protein